MTRTRLGIICLLAGVLAVFCAARAAWAQADQARPLAAEQFMLTGGDGRLWLVRIGPDLTNFETLMYEPGGKWQWVNRDGIRGLPATITAGGKQLYVLTAEPAFLIVDANGTSMGKAPSEDVWPGKSAPLATCLAEGFAGAADGAFLVIIGDYPPAEPVDTDVAHESDPPAEQPAEADGDQPEDAPQPAILPTGLAVLQHAGGEWRKLGNASNVALTEGDSLRAAVVNGRLHVLIANPQQPSALWSWAGDDEPWTQIPLTGQAQSHKPVAMFSAFDQLRLVLSAPAAAEAEDIPPAEQLVIVSLDQAGQFGIPQPITLNGGPLQLPAVPLAASMGAVGDRHIVALFWLDDQTPKFILCDVANGQADGADVLTALTEEPLDTGAQEVMNYFLVVMAGMSFAVMIVSRPKIPAGPLALPMSCRPAPLFKRVLASMIDLLPISMIASLAVPLPQPAADMFADWETFIEQYKILLSTRQAAYSVIVTMCMFMVYGMIMELRYGATLGKMALKLRVIGGDGKRPGLREVLLRNVVKMLELCMPWLLVVPLLTPSRQRLGDILARTAVIEQLGPINAQPETPPPLPEDEPEDN